MINASCQQFLNQVVTQLHMYSCTHIYPCMYMYIYMHIHILTHTYFLCILHTSICPSYVSLLLVISSDFADLPFFNYLSSIFPPIWSLVLSPTLFLLCLYLETLPQPISILIYTLPSVLISISFFFFGLRSFLLFHFQNITAPFFLFFLHE